VVVVVFCLLDRLSDLAENVLGFDVVFFRPFGGELVDSGFDLRVVPKLEAHLLGMLCLVPCLEDSSRSVEVVPGVQISLNEQPLLRGQFVEGIIHLSPFRL
jgi:hypothetical protein